MDCPNCGKRLPEGSIECPRCHPKNLAAMAPQPIIPERAAGSSALALILGLVVAGGGAYVWALTVHWIGLLAWPAIIIGGAVGLVVRVTGKPSEPSNGMIGALCGIVGIGGGLLLIYLQKNYSVKELMSAADVTNLAFIFIGFSLSRSLSSSKSKLRLKISIPPKTPQA